MYNWTEMIGQPKTICNQGNKTKCKWFNCETILNQYNKGLCYNHHKALAYLDSLLRVRKGERIKKCNLCLKKFNNNSKIEIDGRYLCRVCVINFTLEWKKGVDVD